MKRWLCALMILAMLLPMLAACTDKPDVPPEGEGSTPLATLPETPPASGEPTDEGTDAPTEPPVRDLDIVKDGQYLYALVAPAETTALVSDAFAAVAAAMTETFGEGLKAESDKADGAVHGEYVTDTPEILIGETNRIESREVLRTLNQGEYVIRAVGTKLVIVGYTDALTALAAEAFVRDCVMGAEGKSLAIPVDHATLGTPYAAAESTPADVWEDITPEGEMLSGKAMKWMVCELTLTGQKTYKDPVYTVDVDVIFRHTASGKIMVIPAFWDGGTTFKVRFAPTEEGEWQFYTVCSDAENSGLHHRAGTVTCTPYTGELAIYKHGFVKIEPGKSYMMYADGTPFFYLGDTYWNLPLLELDSYGSTATQQHAGISKAEADAAGITSQFTYIMDYRAEQGYTVIQSEPISKWTASGGQTWFEDGQGDIFTRGVSDAMLEKFRQYDRYFAYIAEKGFVHANSQFGWPTNLMDAYFGGKITDTELEKLSRYWVARYGAYPVMWTTTQEGDNDYYGERGDSAATPETNPWLKVFAYVQKHDAYDHPATCHQEEWSYTRVENSAFNKMEGYSWYAAQYNTPFKSAPDWERLREYWNNPGSLPVVNYEGRYDHLWTGTYGARAQGWMAFMNGQVGYGYGVQPLWAIWASGTMSETWVGADEWGEFEQDFTWLEALRTEAGEQVTYMKDYLSAYEWWRLTPCFDRSYFFVPGRTPCVVSHIDSDLYIGYCYGTYNKKEQLGRLTAMKNGDYEVTWFNCRTGEYEAPMTVTVTDGTYKLPARPADGDWAISVRFVG